jgi:flagellar basal-body rod modification protein FlgD
MSYVDSTSAASNPSTASSGSLTSGLNQLDNSQTFLELLVAQLKNQDPDDPTDPTSFMTEIAQLTSVQSQTNLDNEEETVAADSMLNQTVAGENTDGDTVTGQVTGVLLGTSGTPELALSGNQGTIDLSSVSAVYGANTPQAEAASAATTSTT